MNKTTDNPFQRIKIVLILIVGLIGIALAFHLVVQNHAKVAKTVNYTQVKTYNNWAKDYLKSTANGKQTYVQTNDGQGSSKTLSEAQGYGMLATVLAAKKGANSQTKFNSLLRYYLAHQLSATNHLMAWRQTITNDHAKTNTSDQQSATDGDLDIAYALIQADKLWGSQKTNYRLYAKQLLTSIMSREINRQTWLPTVGDWATGSQKKLLRTSDLIPNYFSTFAKFMNNQHWTQVAKNSRSALATLSKQTTTGLIPDFVNVTPGGISTTQSGQVSENTAHLYAYNACRIPWRLAASYQADHNATDRQVLLKLLRFFNGRSRITTNYQLDGTATSNNQDLAFIAPIALGAKVLKQTSLLEKIQTSLTSKIQPDHYYSQTIRLLSELNE